MAADEASKLEAETQDEIEQIMSEIEELQQEMTQTAAAPAAAAPAPAPASAPAPAATPSAVADDLESDRSMSEFVTVEDDGATTTFPEAAGGSSDEEEPWVQETLAELNKPEPRTSSRAMPVAAESAPEYSGSAGGRITLGVQGSLDICLKHEGTNTELVIEFTGDSVHVIVSGGAEFKIPLQAVQRSLRRVA